VFGAVDPRGIGLEVAVEHADVKGPPVPATVPLVVAGSAAPTKPAPAILRASGTDVNHDGSRLFVEVDRLDHRHPVDTEQFAPYVGTEHAILLALSSNL
jgi:hypothetical protein